MCPRIARDVLGDGGSFAPIVVTSLDVATASVASALHSGSPWYFSLVSGKFLSHAFVSATDAEPRVSAASASVAASKR